MKIMFTLLILLLRPVSAARRFAHHITEFTEDDGDLPQISHDIRTTDRASIVGALKGLGTVYWKGNFRKAFCRSSRDGCRTSTGFPDRSTTSYLSHAKCVEFLESVPDRERSGQLYKMGGLSYFVFNELIWEADWKTSPFGADLALHRIARPVIDKIVDAQMGAWSDEGLQASVDAFLDKAQTLDETSISIWWIKELHKILLGLELTDADAEDFSRDARTIRRISVLPRSWAKRFAHRLQLVDAKYRRNFWIRKYENVIRNDNRGIFPEALLGHELRFVADYMLMAIVSVGGQSIPLLISMGLIPLLNKKVKLTDAVIEPFVWETIRTHPPLLGAGWWTPDLSEHQVANVAVALSDPEVWGEDADEFRMRNVSEYQKYASIAFADSARGRDGLTPDSRGCPAKDLSLKVLILFFSKWQQLQNEWDISTAPTGGPFVNRLDMPSAFMIARVLNRGWLRVRRRTWRLRSRGFTLRYCLLLAGDEQHAGRLNCFVDDRRIESANTQWKPDHAHVLGYSTFVKSRKPASRYRLRSERTCVHIRFGGRELQSMRVFCPITGTGKAGDASVELLNGIEHVVNTGKVDV